MTNDLRSGAPLDDVLSTCADKAAAQAVGAFAEASARIAEALRNEPFAALERSEGPSHAIDREAEALLLKALGAAGVRSCVSEESERPVALAQSGSLLAAIDPIDGSTNVEANAPVASILSLLSAPDGEIGPESFLQRGLAQRAAAIALYGPFTELVFTIEAGVHVATLDGAGVYRLTRVDVRVPAGTSEYAINASNARHWPAPVKAYVDDCVAGAEGPRGKDFNMRWMGAMAADVYRILRRGGVYLYPGDVRDGYGEGRLRLLYEANPAALLVERAGGAAIDGLRPILEIEPTAIHQHTPLVFGAAEKVAQVAAYFREDGFPAGRAPLFNRRGLLRG